jgi:hypothetical protein
MMGDGKVVGSEQTCETQVFGGPGNPLPAFPIQAFLALDHQAEFHGGSFLRVAYRVDGVLIL